MIIALATIAAFAAIVIVTWGMIDNDILPTIVGLTILFFTACVLVGLLISAINDACLASRSRSHRKTAEAEAQRRTQLALVEGQASGPDHLQPPHCMSASDRNCDKMGDRSMKFMCPHCGGSEYRLLNGADGRSAAECLNCGRSSTFEQSMLRPPTETFEQAASET